MLPFGNWTGAQRCRVVAPWKCQLSFVNVKPDTQRASQVDDDHGRVPLATLANTLVHADPVVDVEASLGGKCTGITGAEHP